MASALETGELVYLTTRGRRSGRPHRVELWYAYRNGRVYLLTLRRRGRGTDWYENLLAHPSCTLQVGGEEYRGTLIPIEDAAQLKELESQVREMFISKYGREAYRTWYAGSSRIPVEIEVGEKVAPG